LRRLDQGGLLITKQARRGRAAILFGSEKRGLSNEDLSHCHWVLRIPTREEHGSMNLGQAVAVCLYELARGMTKPNRLKPVPAVRIAGKTHRHGKAAKSATNDPANAEDLERITVLLLEALRLSGYIPAAAEPGRSALADEKVRRMVRRLSLSTADAEGWLGMLRQIIWKIGKS
jgi:tRNA C32,U32 (ribose-2'-O)-methylase TrmJ